MRIYIAGCYEERERLEGYAEQLRALGHTIESTWLQETGARGSLNMEQEWEVATRDIEELGRADLMIVDTDGQGQGGREFEMGVAFADHTRIYLVGLIKTPFHRMANGHFTHWGDVIEFLGRAI